MIVFASNFYNHHQAPLAEELFKLTHGKFFFIETVEMPDSFKSSGYTLHEIPPFIIKTWSSDIMMKEAEKIMLQADVLLLGGYSNYKLLKERLKAKRLTFEVGERWLKRGLINLLSPRLIKSQLFYHLLFYNKPLYHLNASAFAANDFKLLHSFKNRMFKWGYFTSVPQLDVKNFFEISRDVSKLKILFIARFLTWKHPKMPVFLADRLKKDGIDFELNMFGSGPELDKTKELVLKLNLEDNVKFCGNRPNQEIIEIIRQHDIFLFTSDRHEGWGAVLNEAMSNGCTVVASDAIGSVPFLIDNYKNGLIYKNLDQSDLYEKVKFLIDNPDKRQKMALNAYQTMSQVWSPRNAAENLLRLIEGINNGTPNIVPNGPASPALPL